ncbi:hypothetical protein ACFV3R_22770 [Streptomyces sp. NPDC059740]|uniref:hypothetical protein n=1 Tax=Streptomyces sp. NPDC059740 TaxID=3346926 RepID=UPI003651E0A0
MSEARTPVAREPRDHAVAPAPVPMGPDVEQAVPEGASAVGTPGVPTAGPKHWGPVLRWGVAALVFALFAGGGALAVTRPARTDLPGLATAPDGRLDFPGLSRPALPAGRPGPFAATNVARIHYADLRSLVLPAPAHAGLDPDLKGTDGWLPLSTYLKEMVPGEREQAESDIVQASVRHLAARGWTTPAGTRTRIYLLQLRTAPAAENLLLRLAPGDRPQYTVRGAANAVSDVRGFARVTLVPEVSRTVYDEAHPRGAARVRQAYVQAGDVLAVVLQSAPEGDHGAEVAFQQTVVLQSQLLG